MLNLEIKSFHKFNIHQALKKKNGYYTDNKTALINITMDHMTTFMYSVVLINSQSKLHHVHGADTQIW